MEAGAAESWDEECGVKLSQCPRDVSRRIDVATSSLVDCQ